MTITNSRSLNFAIASTVLMSAIPVLQKLVLKNVSAPMVAFSNAFFCASGCLIFFAIQRRWPRFQFREHSIAALLYAVGMLGFMYALARLSADAVALSGRAYGLFCVILGAYFLGEALSKETIAAVASILIGSVLYIYRPQDTFDFLGYGGMLLYTLCFAINNVYVKRKKLVEAPWDLMFWTFAMATLLLAIYLLPILSDITMPSPLSMSILAASSIFGSVLGTWLFYQSLASVPLSVQGALRSLGPIFTTAIAWPIFGVHLNLTNFLGGTLALCGLVLISWSSMRPYRKAN